MTETTERVSLGSLQAGDRVIGFGTFVRKQQSFNRGMFNWVFIDEDGEIRSGHNYGNAFKVERVVE